MKTAGNGVARYLISLQQQDLISPTGPKCIARLTCGVGMVITFATEDYVNRTRSATAGWKPLRFIRIIQHLADENGPQSYLFVSTEKIVVLIGLVMARFTGDY